MSCEFAQDLESECHLSQGGLAGNSDLNTPQSEAYLTTATATLTPSL